MADLTPDDQLAAWLRGESLCPNTRDECCPDFSCCNPDALAPLEQRRAFVEGTPEVREHLCLGFLGNAFSDVHVAGLTRPEDA